MDRACARGGAALALVVLSAFLACGPSSRDACDAYVVHARALPCVEDEPATCSDDEERCHRADYWLCLRDTTGCDDAGVLVTDAESCDPTCREAP